MRKISIQKKNDYPWKTKRPQEPLYLPKQRNNWLSLNRTRLFKEVAAKKWLPLNKSKTMTSIYLPKKNGNLQVLREISICKKITTPEQPRKYNTYLSPKMQRLPLNNQINKCIYLSMGFLDIYKIKMKYPSTIKEIHTKHLPGCAWCEILSINGYLHKSMRMMNRTRQFNYKSIKVI